MAALIKSVTLHAVKVDLGSGHQRHYNQSHLILVLCSTILYNGVKWNCRDASRDLPLVGACYIIFTLFGKLKNNTLKLLYTYFCGFCSNRILPYFPLLVCSSVTGVTSHISHIYKGINAMLIIRGPIKPCIFWIKIILAIFLAKTRPDKTIFSALTNLTIDFDFELSKI